MRVTLNDLARLAGVSNATVSVALSDKHKGRVSEKVRKRILALARKHGYRRNLAARALVQGRTYRIGMCVHGNLSTYSVTEMIDFYEQFVMYSQAIQSAGYAVELVELEPSRSGSETSADLSKRFVDGLVFPYWPPGRVTELLAAMKKKGIPAVCSGSVLKDDTLTWTGVDESAVFEDATRYLIEQGHERIALLDIRSGANPEAARHSFLRIMKNKLRRDAEAWVFHMEKPRVGELVNATNAALDAIKGVRAFLITENVYCHAVLHALQDRNMAPGKDCRVIGFGETFEASKARPRLSHYCIKNKDQVEFSVAALLEQIRNPAGYQSRHKLIEPVFVQLET